MRYIRHLAVSIFCTAILSINAGCSDTSSEGSSGGSAGESTTDDMHDGADPYHTSNADEHEGVTVEDDPSECGDGACEADEDNHSCPSDCSIAAGDFCNDPTQG